MAALLACFGAMAAMAHAQPVGGSIRLKAATTVEGPRVCLAEIATLDGSVEPALAELEVARFEAAEPRELTVTLATVRQRLTDRGVNWGRLSLGGFTRCVVRRAEPAAPDPSDLEDDGAVSVGDPQVTDVAANPIASVAPGSAVSARARVVDMLARHVGVPGDQLRVSFSDRDAARLEDIPAAARLEFEPHSGTGLGRVPVVIRLWQGSEVLDTVRVTATVAKRALVVVATEGIDRGDTVLAGDVEIAEAWIDSGVVEPLTHLPDAIGQMCVTTLRAGAVIEKAHLEAPRLVRRGDIITVRALAGRIVVRMAARALEDGTMDQVINARNERSRETLRVRVTARQQAIAEGALR